MSRESTSFLSSNGNHKPISLVAEFSSERDNWFLWKERFDIFLEEAEYTENKQKSGALLNMVGAEAYSVLHNLCDPVKPIKKDYDELCKMLESQFTPNVVLYDERQKFYKAEKLDNETIAAWHLRVKKLAAKCKFGAHLDAYVTDRFICGLRGKIFERLCEEDEITLTVAFKKATIAETRLANRKETESDEVNFVQRHKTKYNNKSKEAKGQASAKAKQLCEHCG